MQVVDFTQYILLYFYVYIYIFFQYMLNDCLEKGKKITAQLLWEHVL